jgi:hypothetical protein
MSQFYDLASLVVIPSGYKASTIYAQKPLTTDGQLSFSRASTATRINSSGALETVASNVPRLDYTNSSCPKILLEPQRLNALTYSNDFSNAAWSKVGSPVLTSGQADWSGATNAWKWEASASGVTQLAQNFVTAAATNNMSFYAKAGTVSTVSIWIGSAVDFNLSTGSVTAGTGTITSIGNGWYRCSTNRASITGGNGFNPYFSASAAGQYVLIAYAQGEDGANPTSYIPTTTASVTRVADAASKTGISSLIGQTEGTMFVDYNYEVKPDVNGNIPMVILGGGNEAYVFITGGGTLLCELYVGGALQCSINGVAGTAGRKKIAFAYKQNDFAVYLNGNLIGTDNSGTVGGMNNLHIGGYYTANFNVNGGINQALLFKTRLTNAQLSELTTL